MKKLNFVLKSNGEILYDENVSYLEIGNYINFKIENSEFKFCLMENFHFIKETSEDIFEIKNVESNVTAKYILKTHDVMLDINVIDFEYTFRDKIFNIKYNIESDPDSMKEIILTLD